MKNLESTLKVRLQKRHYGELEKMAEASGLKVSAYVRVFLLKLLSGDLDDGIAKLETGKKRVG